MCDETCHSDIRDAHETCQIDITDTHGIKASGVFKKATGVEVAFIIFPASSLSIVKKIMMMKIGIST